MKHLVDYKIIDSGYDNFIKSEYVTYSINYQDLIEIVKSWYPNENFDNFDIKSSNQHSRNDVNVMLQKKIGIITNIFLAYNENSSYFLLDGFKRLLSSYQTIDIDSPVYLKVLTSELSDSKLMSLMLELNAWKILDRSGSDIASNLFDRGWMLFLKYKFKLNVYHGNADSYAERIKYVTDIEILSAYCKNERESVGYFNLDLIELRQLFNNKQIIDDLNELFTINNWVKSANEFHNQDDFILGYAMFLSRERLKNNENNLPYEYFLSCFKKNTKVFKKITNMSGTDSTRKNIYNFYENCPKP